MDYNYAKIILGSRNIFRNVIPLYIRGHDNYRIQKSFLEKLKNPGTLSGNMSRFKIEDTILGKEMKEKCQHQL